MGTTPQPYWKLRRLLLALLLVPPSLAGQDTIAPAQTPPGDAGETDTFWSRFWISGQINIIRQQHPSFDSAYSGPNSFQAPAEHATSHVETLYTGFRILKNLEILCDIESAGGFGLSSALGIAGFTNVDVVRNPALGQTPYVSRV